MRFFSKEDNKKLYESNLPDILKNYIANFNEIIICFIKEKFSDKENLEEILNKIKESFIKTEYKINEQIDSNASFIYNTSTKEKTFEINDKTLDMYSVEEGLIAIYFHEFSHFISYTLDSRIGSRMEEGIADLFSDELTEYFNKSFVERKIINFKDSTYKKPAIIIRNACLINNESNELIWNYYTNKERTKQFFEQAYGKEAADLIFKIEEYTDNYSYISDEEEKYIEIALNKIDVLNSKEIYNKINPLLHKKIYEKVREKNLSLEDLKKNYPNISNDFYKDYEINFSIICNKKEEMLNKESINQIETNELIKEFLDYISIDKFENPNKKHGIYNEYVIDMPLELIKYNNIFKLGFGSIVPILYAYKKRYNEEEYNQEEFEKILLGIGYDRYLSEKEFNKIVDISKESFKEFTKLTKKECFSYIKNQLKNQIEEKLNIEYYEKKYEANKIKIEQYINKMIELYKNSEKTYSFNPNSYINSTIKNYVKYKDLELKLENFNTIKNEIENIIKDLNISYIPDINAQILWAWNINKLSIYNVVDIISKYGIDSTVEENMFEDIRVKGLTEIKNEKDINNIIKYIAATTTNTYQKSKVFYYHKSSNSYDKNEVFKKIEEEIFKKIEKYSKENKGNINEEILKNNINLVKFYKYRWLNEIDDEEKRIIKELIGKECNKFSDCITSTFDDELYEKLKKYPYLALTYLAYFYPNDSTSIAAIKISIDKSEKLKNEFLKNAYKNQFIELVKDFNKNFKFNDNDLRYVDIYELELLKRIPTQILDEETEKEFAKKLLDLINQKIQKIFIENYETQSNKRMLKLRIESNIENNLENYRDEIKEEIQKLYNKLKKIKLPEPPKKETNFKNLNDSIKNITEALNKKIK